MPWERASGEPRTAPGARVLGRDARCVRAWCRCKRKRVVLSGVRGWRDMRGTCERQRRATRATRASRLPCVPMERRTDGAAETREKEEASGRLARTTFNNFLFSVFRALSDLARTTTCPPPRPASAVYYCSYIYIGGARTASCDTVARVGMTWTTISGHWTRLAS